MRFAHEIIAYPYLDFIKIFSVVNTNYYNLFFIYESCHRNTKILKKKLIKEHLTRKIIAIESGISYSKICDLVIAKYTSPELKTLLEIANYFNCAIDEIIGRNHYIKNKQIFYKISAQDMIVNLKQFLIKKIKENNLNSYTLSKNTSLSNNAIRYFLKESNTNKTLGSAVTVALADYFQVSLDEMIGRVEPTTAVNCSDGNSDRNIDLNNS